jgi:hypothetical protein
MEKPMLICRLATITALALFVLLTGNGSAKATSCTVPNSFVNNTVADADQMNANFTAILTCINVNSVVGPNSSTVGDFACFGNASGNLLSACTTAWTPYTPTITCGSGGSPTTSTTGGRYKKVGKIVEVSVTALVTTYGTCGSWLFISLPVASGGVVNVIPGYVCTATYTNGPTIPTNILGAIAFINPTDSRIIAFKYDGTFPAVAGDFYTVSCTYESA